MEPEVTVYHVASPSMKASLGVATKREGGWKFVPTIPGRISSRKLFPSHEKCIPRWVRVWMRKRDFRLMTREEAVALGIVRQ